MQTASPRQFGKYTVLDRLGVGGMGEVYLVLARDSGRLFALKSLLGEVDKEVVTGFHSEAKLLAKLNSPYLEDFAEFVTDVSGDLDRAPVERRWLVKEFIDGVALRSIFVASEGSLPDPVAYHIGLEMLAGLAYLHRFEDPAHAGGTQLVHGDLSPNNVMVSFTGQVKLIDLGLSCFPRQALTPTEPSRWLNVRYSSPDRMMSQRRSITDDLFAFGLLLWDLLTGSPYWIGCDTKEIYKKLRDFSPRDIREVRPALSEEAATLVRGCLWHENFYGFSEATEVAEAIRAIVAKENCAMTQADLATFVQSACANEHIQSKRRQNMARLHQQSLNSANPPPAEPGILQKLRRKLS